MAEEIARRPEYETAFTQAQETLAGIETVTREKEQRLTGLRSRKEALETRQSQLDELTAQSAENTRLLRSWEEQFEQYNGSIRKHEQVIARKAEIEAGFTGYTAARKTGEELSAKFQQSVSLERQKSPLQTAIDAARHELEKERALVKKDLETLEARASRLPELRSQLTELQGQFRMLEVQEKLLDEKEEAVQEARRQVSFIEAETGRLEREIAEVGEKLDLITSHLASHTDARCPLCESELTQEGLELIRTKYTREQQEQTAKLQANQADLVQKRAIGEDLGKELARVEYDLNREKSAVQNRISSGTDEIERIEAEETQLDELQAGLNAIEDRLENKDYAAPEREALESLEAEIASLGYDATTHERVQEEVRRLQLWEPEKTGLDEAERLIDQEKANLSRAEKNIRVFRESRVKDAEKQETLKRELAGLPALREEVTAAETEYRDLSAQRSRAQETVGSVRERLERLKELETRRKEREQALNTVVKEATIYRDLTRAFGKTGIQALLIESAIPDIESEANRLLARMTDNRMHVNFKTQEETKQGTVRETLDITITDELGTRDYEMFSGGEAFRINFAIRIALSRLLAKRAGAPLPTLIIDEGFGTQDNTGLEKLKEAINSIQDDFEKIIVITHMDELKDAFPTRIDVVKTGEGSSITVI
ncbi:MAG: SMC family ATPase, partial [Dehalococcoidales bacterium]|nr:SMC family ATPase [Dehalococcoidales bacterium]